MHFDFMTGIVWQQNKKIHLETSSKLVLNTNPSLHRHLKSRKRLFTEILAQEFKSLLRVSLLKLI